MPATVNVNNLTVVHKTSDGSVNFMPDVCLTPAPPGSPVPIPYSNLALSKDTAEGSKTVKVDGNPIMLQGSNFSTSTGDEAGSVGGVGSGVTKGKAEFISYSFDVLVEGKCVPRLGDLMLGNKGGTPNTAPVPEVQPPLAPAATAVSAIEPDRMVIVLKDWAGNPIANERYVLELAGGEKREGKTDGSGRVTVEKTWEGIGRVIFPECEDRLHKEDR